MPKPYNSPYLSILGYGHCITGYLNDGTSDKYYDYVVNVGACGGDILMQDSAAWIWLTIGETAVLATTILCVATVAAAILMLPVLLFAIECIAGVWPSVRRSSSTSARPPVAVLIPAHNESSGIASTLRNVREQARPGDRLVVVADNCDDDTAEIARSEGAEVVVRKDPVNRGKGYALDAGIRYLAQTPCDVVMILDADCRIQPGTINELAAAALSTGRPVQARNLVHAPPGSGLNLAVAEFAFLVKNHVRPLGLSRLGLPCQLTGTGMAFPWAVIEGADLANGHRTEDMKLGLELAAAGYPSSFCNNAMVTSLFPYSDHGLETQRQRWEGGHLSMMRFAFRSLFSVRRGLTLSYLLMLLDVMIPPLTLLVAASVAILLLNAVVAVSGVGVLPLAISGASLVLLVIAVGLGWLAHGRTVLPARNLAQIPLYAISKLKSYPKVVLLGKNSTWVRTDRSSK
ncbi:glycosyltransferase family 2 protein [Rhizobium sp. S152]|uniref:glycosyltransferase family 2 protein n=1 Tax=Rhizobium sp. S152 TaxID=3055038 RepID=UPI0025AA15C9|nr:glycosyltransferase family 2 protein [Rhizobium sp. S152]MDM9624617.1 glycosyltransferase family 2 protein [Rhizobium sp. S152]